MTVPKGTYLRAGQPTKYKGQETIDQSIEYIESCTDIEATEEIAEVNGRTFVKKTAAKVRFPNQGGLARHLGVSVDTVNEWTRVHEEFKNVVDAINAEQQDRLMNGGLSGTYNSTIASLILGRHGYRKMVDNNISNPDGSLSPVKKLSDEQVRALAEAEVAKKKK